MVCSVNTNGLSHVQQPSLDPVLDGNQIVIDCQSGHRYSSLEAQQTYECLNGAWNETFKDCGKFFPSAKAIIFLLSFN